MDHAATTPLDPRVLDAMMPYLSRCWGNPSSVYMEAQEARRGLEEARRTVARILGCRPQEIIFTSGATEANNLALRGVAYAMAARGRHIVTTAIEHHSVLHVAERLEKEGFRVTYLPVDGEGFVELGALEEAVGPDTILVSIMYVNNEVGTIEPIAQAVQIVKGRNPKALFHTDAVQAVGILELDVGRLGVDLLTIGAHKFYGPKGVGALYIRSRTPLLPQQLGGAQERNRRAGTENVAGIVGMAKALELAYEERDLRVAHYRALRDRLLWELPQRLAGVYITGPKDPDRRIAHIASFCIEGVEGEGVLMALDLEGIAASSGSACTSGSLEPSHVLRAMGVPETLARGSLRLSVGRENTMEQIERVLAVLPQVVERLRSLSPLRRAAPRER